jgi:DNA-binding beta-propeller fold protein YncE
MQRFFVCALVALAGCHVDLNDPGTDPPVAQFHFPAGLMLDPAGQYLYVSNGNSDLAFSGGTLQMVDLARFDCAVARYKNANRGTSLDVSGCDPFPDSDWQSTASNTACIDDPLDPMVVDCDETPFILANQTVKVGNFAGNMQLRNMPDTDVNGNVIRQHRQLYIGVRGDPSITTVDVFPNLDGTFGRALDCFDTAPDPNSTIAPACTASHQVQFFDCAGQPSCMMGNGTYPPGQQLIPTEPFSLKYDEGTLSDGATPYHRLVISHLQTGQVSIMDTDIPGPNSIADVSPAFFPEDSQHRHGAFSLQPQHPGQGASTMWFMTSNLQPLITTFRIADVNVVVPSVTFSIASQFNAGADGRSLVFQPDGNRLFMTENSPPSVLIFDTSTPTGPAMPGAPMAALRDVVNVCSLPSHLDMFTVNWQGGEGAPTRPLQRLYVMCFVANQIMVVDPDRPGVDDTILVGRGPNDLVFKSGNGVTPRAYVTLFSEHTVGVLDLQPGSPTEHRMTARIGLPVPPVNFQ